MYFKVNCSEENGADAYMIKVKGLTYRKMS